jgi:maltodextrin utilization protein YvdJ
MDLNLYLLSVGVAFIIALYEISADPIRITKKELLAITVCALFWPLILAYVVLYGIFRFVGKLIMGNSL